MTRWMLALGLVLTAGVARAQERVPDEDAKKIAELLVQAAAKVKPPLKVEADADSPYAKHKDEYGAMVMPVKGLEAKTIAGAKGDLIAVGQLWMKGLTPIGDKEPTAAKKLLIVPVTYQEKELNLVLCSLGVQTVKDKLSLVVLGKEKTPLATLPLEKIDETQDRAIEFGVTIEENERATLILTFLGKYRARLRVGVLAD